MIAWYYLVIISAIFNAGTLVIEKSLLKSEHALSFSVSITFFTALLSLLLIPFATLPITPYQLFLLLIYSVLLALAYWMSARLFRHGSLSTGSPLYAILPIITTIVLAFIFLGENIGVMKYLAILVIISAAFIMIEQSNKKRDQFQKNYYDLAIMATAVLVGSANVLLKYSLTQINVYDFILFTSIFTPVIVSLLMMRRPKEYKKETSEDIRKFAKPLILMAALSLGYRIFLYTGISMAPVSLAIPLSSAIIVLVTVLSGGLLFGEHHMRRKVAFSIIMLIAVYFLVA